MTTADHWWGLELYIIPRGKAWHWLFRSQYDHVGPQEMMIRLCCVGVLMSVLIRCHDLRDLISSNKTGQSPTMIWVADILATPPSDEPGQSSDIAVCRADQKIFLSPSRVNISAPWKHPAVDWVGTNFVKLVMVVVGGGHKSPNDRLSPSKKKSLSYPRKVL